MAIFLFLFYKGNTEEDLIEDENREITSIILKQTNIGKYLNFFVKSLLNWIIFTTKTKYI